MQIQGEESRLDIIAWMMDIIFFVLCIYSLLGLSLMCVSWSGLLVSKFGHSYISCSFLSYVKKHMEVLLIHYSQSLFTYKHLLKFDLLIITNLCISSSCKKHSPKGNRVADRLSKMGLSQGLSHLVPQERYCMIFLHKKEVNESGATQSIVREVRSCVTEWKKAV